MPKPASSPENEVPRPSSQLGAAPPDGLIAPSIFGVGTLPHGLLKQSDLAKVVGVSRSTINDLRANGVLPEPSFRRGRVLRWSALEIAAWSACGCPDTRAWPKMWRPMRRRIFGDS